MQSQALRASDPILTLGGDAGVADERDDRDLFGHTYLSYIMTQATYHTRQIYATRKLQVIRRWSMLSHELQVVRRLMAD
jgi:hypothetical protein